MQSCIVSIRTIDDNALLTRVSMACRKINMHSTTCSYANNSWVSHEMWRVTITGYAYVDVGCTVCLLTETHSLEYVQDLLLTYCMYLVVLDYKQ